MRGKAFLHLHVDKGNARWLGLR